jgi:hypothetical protein
VGTFSRGTSVDPWYVTGFCEGEASFTFSRQGAHLALYFAVKLTGSDRPLLETLQAFFGGAGKIYAVKARAGATPRSGLTKKAAYFRVCRRDELPVILAHFDAYPLYGEKAASYRVWRQMVLLKQAFRRSKVEELNALAVQLSQASTGNQAAVAPDRAAP